MFIYEVGSWLVKYEIIVYLQININEYNRFILIQFTFGFSRKFNSRYSMKLVNNVNKRR